MKAGKKETKPKTVSYGKYGYLFIAPFFIVYLVFSLWPLINTFYYSMFEYTTRNLRTTITFTGLQNYLNVLGIADGPARRVQLGAQYASSVVVKLCTPDLTEPFGSRMADQ